MHLISIPSPPCSAFKTYNCGTLLETFHGLTSFKKRYVSLQFCLSPLTFHSNDLPYNIMNKGMLYKMDIM